MVPKLIEKNRAIELRRQGLSYKEILKEVLVSKSSLSLWLKDFPLTAEEKIFLRKRKEGNITRGRIRAGAVHRRNRLIREKEYFISAKTIFKQYKDDPLFHIGIALYWAEGARRHNQFLFTNSDYEMALVMIHWLEKFVQRERITLRYRLYIHKPYAHEHLEALWMKKLGVSEAQFVKTVYKPTNLGVKKRPGYIGCLRIEVPKSHALLCQMKFWQSMQFEYLMKG